MQGRTAVWIFALAWAVRLAYVAWAYDGPESLYWPDSTGYQHYAAWLAGEIAPGEAPTELLSRRTPGYPLYLAAFRRLLGPNPLWPVLGQTAIDALNCVLIGWLAALLVPRLALLAGVLAALNLNLIGASGVVLSETLFLTPWLGCLIAAVAYLRRPTAARAAWAGGCIGLGVLVRPAAQFYPLVLLAGLALGGVLGRVGARRVVAHLALALLCTAVVVGPRLARNHREHGAVALTSVAGHFLLDYQVPLTWSWASGRPWKETRAELHERLDRHLAAEGLTALPDDPFASSRHQSAVALVALREIGPLGIARAWLSVAALNLFAPSLVSVPAVRALERPRLDDSAGGGGLARVVQYGRTALGSPFLRWVALGALLTLALRGLQLVGLLRIGRPQGLPLLPTLFLLASAAYFVAVTGAHASVRYRIPQEPVLIILLAAGIALVGDRVRARGS